MSSLGMRSLTLSLVAMFILTCGFVAFSDSNDAVPDDQWKGVNYTYRWDHETGQTAISMNSTYKIPLGTDFLIASWDKENQCFNMGNGTTYTIPDSRWTYGPPYYDTPIEKPVMKPADNMVLKGWATSMMDLTIVYLPGEVVTADNTQNLILYCVFEIVEADPEIYPEPEPEPTPKPYVRPNIPRSPPTVVEKVTLNYFAGGQLVHVDTITKGSQAFEPVLPVGFSAWNFNFNTPILENTEVYAIPSPAQAPVDDGEDVPWWFILLLAASLVIILIAYYDKKRKEA